MNEDRVCVGVNASVHRLRTTPTSHQIRAHTGANCAGSKSLERRDHRGKAPVSLAPKHPRSTHQLKPEQHTENICAVLDSTAMSTPGLNHINRALAGLLKRSFVLRGACFPPTKPLLLPGPALGLAWLRLRSGCW